MGSSALPEKFIYIFWEFFPSIEKNFIQGVKIGTRLSFYEILRLS